MDFKTTRITRRNFLKFMGLGSLALMLPARATHSVQASSDYEQLGRAAYNQYVRSEPSHRATMVGKFLYNNIIKIPAATTIKTKDGKLERWYEIGSNRYLYAGYVQPVKNIRNVSDEPIPESGRLGEITVPIVDVYTGPRTGKTLRKFYYSSTFWVKERHFDAYGVPWYELLDDVNDHSYFIRAYTMRLVPYEELSPLSPEVPPEEKRIELNLLSQRVTAFEYEHPVFSCLVSTGLHEGSTPIGNFMTNRKRPCRRMVNYVGDASMHYDLPGVPWVSYVTLDGVAFHGAYWHSNWGNVMSNGCINMSPEQAKWLYRWCTPTVPLDKYYYGEDTGTRVNIINW